MPHEPLLMPEMVSVLVPLLRARAAYADGVTLSVSGAPDLLLEALAEQEGAELIDPESTEPRDLHILSADSALDAVLARLRPGDLLALVKRSSPGSSPEKIWDMESAFRSDLEEAGLEAVRAIFPVSPLWRQEQPQSLVAALEAANDVLVIGRWPGAIGGEAALLEAWPDTSPLATLYAYDQLLQARLKHRETQLEGIQGQLAEARAQLRRQESQSSSQMEALKAQQADERAALVRQMAETREQVSKLADKVTQLEWRTRRRGLRKLWYRWKQARRTRRAAATPQSVIAQTSDSAGTAIPNAAPPAAIPTPTPTRIQPTLPPLSPYEQKLRGRLVGNQETGNASAD